MRKLLFILILAISVPLLATQSLANIAINTIKSDSKPKKLSDVINIVTNGNTIDGDTFYSSVYPVLYPDIVEFEGEDVIHFVWRRDYKGKYEKAIILSTKGEVLSEIKYPENRLPIKSLPKGHKEIYICTVNASNEYSLPEKIELNIDYNNLYETEMPRITISVSDEGRAVFMKGNDVFLPNGANHCGIKYGDHDSFEPNRGDIISGAYDPLQVETEFRLLKKHGYNIIRVFIKTGMRHKDLYGLSGPYETNVPDLYKPYMDNFIDFLTRAAKYGIYVMPCFCENERLNNRYWEKRFDGTDGQTILFSDEGINAKKEYISLFLNYIKNINPKLLNSIFGLTMQNEFHFVSNLPPFAPKSIIENGIPTQTYNYTYNFLGKEYQMNDAKQRRELARAAIKRYYREMKKAVESEVPGMLIGEGTFAIGAVGKDIDSYLGLFPIDGVEDQRFPMSALEYLNTDIDFLDFHVYRWGIKGTGYDVFKHFARDMQLDSEEGLKWLEKKPVIMGEYGSFKFEETTLEDGVKFSKELKQAALDFGIQGTIFWTLDTFEQTGLWNMMWDNSRLLKALK